MPRWDRRAVPLVGYSSYNLRKISLTYQILNRPPIKCGGTGGVGNGMKDIGGQGNVRLDSDWQVQCLGMLGFAEGGV